MAEISGATELQMLQQELAVLKSIKESLIRAEPTSAYCQRILQSIMKQPEPLLETYEQPSPYHTPVSTSTSAEGGCCALL